MKNADFSPLCFFLSKSAAAHSTCRYYGQQRPGHLDCYIPGGRGVSDPLGNLSSTIHRERATSGSVSTLKSSGESVVFPMKSCEPCSILSRPPPLFLEIGVRAAISRPNIHVSKHCSAKNDSALFTFLEHLPPHCLPYGLKGLILAR